MKEVIAIVKPFLAERVLEALKFAPLEACTSIPQPGRGGITGDAGLLTKP